MELIDKAAVVAAIKTIYNEDYKFLPSDLVESVQDFKDDLLMALDGLYTVKEVDLEKEVDDYVNEYFSKCDDGVLISDANSMELTLLDITPLAKHFFKLGLKTKNNNESIHRH